MAGPKSSNEGASAGEQTSGRQGMSFTVCTIEDSFAHAGSYLVRLPAGRLVNASDLNSVGCVPLGARPASSYPIKSRVIVVQIPGVDQYVIIGSVGKSIGDPNLVLPDSIVLRSQVGLFQDPLHFSVFSNPKSDLGNFSAGRPADVLPGDWGVATDLGMMVFLGRMMATIKASDGAKVEAFWGDDLLRLVGYNYELFTAGAEDRRINDEGEYNEFYRCGMFPWEGLGIAKMGTAVQMADGRLKPDSGKAKYEPLVDDQLIVQRYLKMGGYIGDIQREFVCSPPANLQRETYSAQTKYAGLLDIVKSSNGAFAVRSAKEIILEKYSLIAVPKELIAPEDPLGDNIANYKAGDLQGGGTQYQLPEFIWGADDNAGIRSAQLFEEQAYLLGKYCYAAVTGHTKDWFVPEEGELTEPVSSTVYDKNIKIGFQFLAPLPGFGELIIDQRPGHSVRYYKSRSCIQQLDDGSIVIEDGYGSQIMMKGGSIFFSCVGDVWAQPGRNFIAWAPHDAILRAGNCADISASKHDVRIKAERNVQVLAGNDQSGIGGVLIESRSNQPSSAADFAQTGQQVEGHGITLKAGKSSIQAFGQTVYIGRNQTTAGDLIIDGGDLGTTYIRGQSILSKASQILSLMIETTKGTTQQAIAINPAGALVSCPMEIGGTVIIAPTGTKTNADLYVGGNISANGGIVAKDSVITNASFGARQGAPYVGKLPNDIPIPDPSQFTAVIEAEVTELATRVARVNEAAVDSAATSPGNDDFQKAVGYSCRSTIQDIKLDSSTFILFEARWQQMLRKAGQQVTWDEPTVMAPNGEVGRPHPGQDGWTNFQAFGTVDGTNFDYQAGHAANRSAMTNQGQQPTKNTLLGGYLINIQGS